MDSEGGGLQAYGGKTGLHQNELLGEMKIWSGYTSLVVVKKARRRYVQP